MSLLSKGGSVVRALTFHPCGPGSNPGVDAICGLSLLLILSLNQEVSLRVPQFPPLLKNHHLLYYSLVLYFIVLCNVLCGIVLYCTVIVFIFCRYFQTQIEAVLMAITRNIVTFIKKDANEEVYLYIKMFRCYDE